MTHTQGPWMAIDDKIYTAADNNEVAVVTRYGAWLKGTNPSPYGRDNPIWKANAKLIATAPDMLEALKGCLAIMEDEDLDKIYSGLAKMVRDAIAKAEGTKK